MNQRRIFWTLSLIAGLLMTWTSFEALLLPFYYINETDNWRGQSMGQDFINLVFVIPFYLYTAIFMSGSRWYFPLLWAGVTLYLIYTYLIYCFDIHFNGLFVLYCLILCIHFYLLLYLLFLYWHKPLSTNMRSRLTGVTGLYFIAVSLIFYCLWLAEIIPASINGSVPDSLEKVGLFTNPVHVLDISFVLPGIMITGFLLLLKKRLGTTLAPVLLTFLFLMELTIGGLILILWQKGLENHPLVAWCMFALAAFSFVLLLLHVKRTNVAV